MAKIIKKASMVDDVESEKHKNFNTEIKKFSKNLGDFFLRDGISTFSHRDKILAVKNANIVAPFLEKMYIMRLGETIGFWENNKFSPNARAYRDLRIENFSKIALQNEQELDFYLRGGMLECDSD